MSNNLVQTKAATFGAVGGDGSQTVSFNSNTTTGNTIVACVMVSRTIATTGGLTITDNVNSGAYSNIGPAQGFAGGGTPTSYGWMQYYPNITGGATTVTVAYISGDNSSTEVNVILREYTSISSTPVEAYGVGEDHLNFHTLAIIPLRNPTYLNVNAQDILVGMAWTPTAITFSDSAAQHSSNTVSATNTNTSLGASDYKTTQVSDPNLNMSIQMSSSQLSQATLGALFIDPLSQPTDTNIIGSSSGALTVSTDKFNVLYGAGSGWGTAVTTQSVMPTAGTLKNFYVNIDTTNPSGKTFAVYKNGVDQALTITIPNGSTSGNDTTHTVTYAAGDTISIHASGGDGVNSVGIVRWTLAATQSASSMIIGSSGAAMGTTFPCYIGMQGINTSTTINSVESVMPTAGTIKNAYIVLNANASATMTFTLVQNTVDTAIVVTVASGASTGNDLTHTVTATAGDKFYWRCNATGASSRTASISTEFDPTVLGESVHMFGNAGSGTSTSAARWQTLTSDSTTYGSTEAPRQTLSQAATWKKLYVFQQTALTGAGTYQYQLSVNTTAGNPTVTMSSASTSGNDTVNTRVTSAGDAVAMKVTPASTPTASNAEWGIVSFIQPATLIYNHNLTLLDVGC